MAQRYSFAYNYKFSARGKEKMRDKEEDDKQWKRGGSDGER